MQRLGLLGVLLIALVSLGWWNSSLREDLKEAEKQLSVKDRQIEDAAKNEAALQAEIKIAKARQDQLSNDLRELRELEGYNAPLSDFLNDAYDRM